MSQHPRSPRTARRRALGLVLAAALAVPLGGFGITAAAAEAPQPSAHYDMSHRGGTLLDVSGNERHASLTGFGDGSFVRAGEDEVLRFAGDGYAALPQGIVTGSDNDFTVEYTVTTRTAANHFGWVLGDGVGPWNTSELGNHVFLSPRSAQSGYGDQVLSAIRVKRDGGNGEVRLPAGGGLGAGFTTLTMVGEGDRLTVYRDGEQISTVQHPYELSSIIPSGEVLGYLGRSLYAGDPLFVGDVSDVKFWDEALSAEQLAAAQPTAAEKAAASEGILRLDLGAIVLGSNPSFDRVTRKLSLPSAVNGVALGWASSDESVVALDGRVSREIAVDTPVTLTATLAGGARLEFAVTVLAPSIEADLDAIVLAERSGEHLPLAVTGAVEGSRITWTSSDPALVTPTDPAYAPPAVGMADPFAGGGVVTRPAYGEGDREVVLTATAQLGERSVSRDYAVTIAERGRSAPDAGYASAYFRSDGDERIYAAATEGNDFFSFSEVNDGRPIVDNSADTTGHRDPYILRSHGGDTYYMIATDLCIGCGTSWGEAQSNGSLKVNVWESSDLVHWSRTNGDENGGITINRPEAGMTWAPEAYWDDELQSYVVFFASRMYDDEAHTSGPGHARMFAVLTRDFVSFTSPPETWQDTGFARIDSTVQKIGDTYYRFTKNEEGGAADGLERGKDIFMERSRVLTAPTTRSDWDADPATGWQLVDTAMTTPITGHAGEGPQIIRLNEGDPANQDGDGYVFLVDNYGDGGYRAFVTSGAALAASERGQRISQQPEWSVRERGGLPPSPRHGAFVSVTRQVLDAMHAWSEVRPAESRTEVSVEGRELTARVSALDGGEVAGTVTFAGGSWRETVTVQPAERAAPGSAEAGDADAVAGDADAAAAVAAVRVPAGVTEVSVRYDGYRDGLVAPSAAEPVSLPGGGTADAGGATADAGGGTAAAAGSGSSDGSEAGASAAGGDPELAATGAPGRGSVLLTAALLLGLGAALVLVRQRRARS